MSTPSSTRRPDARVQTKECAGQPLGHALGGQLAQAVFRVAQALREDRRQVSSETRVAVEERLDPRPIPRQRVARLERLGRGGVGRVAQDAKAAENLARRDDAQDDLRALLGYLGHLDPSRAAQKEAPRRLALLEEGLVPAGANLASTGKHLTPFFVREAPKER